MVGHPFLVIALTIKEDVLPFYYLNLFTQNIVRPPRSRSNSPHSRGNASRSRGKVAHSRGNASRSRSNSPHSRGNASHSRSNTPHSRGTLTPPHHKPSHKTWPSLHFD